jgi:hypothetical protein
MDFVLPSLLVDDKGGDGWIGNSNVDDKGGSWILAYLNLVQPFDAFKTIYNFILFAYLCSGSTTCMILAFDCSF